MQGLDFEAPWNDIKRLHVLLASRPDLRVCLNSAQPKDKPNYKTAAVDAERQTRILGRSSTRRCPLAFINIAVKPTPSELALSTSEVYAAGVSCNFAKCPWPMDPLRQASTVNEVLLCWDCYRASGYCWRLPLQVSLDLSAKRLADLHQSGIDVVQLLGESFQSIIQFYNHIEQGLIPGTLEALSGTQHACSWFPRSSGGSLDARAVSEKRPYKLIPKTSFCSPSIVCIFQIPVPSGQWVQLNYLEVLEALEILLMKCC